MYNWSPPARWDFVLVHCSVSWAWEIWHSINFDWIYWINPYQAPKIPHIIVFNYNVLTFLLETKEVTLPPSQPILKEISLQKYICVCVCVQKMILIVEVIKCSSDALAVNWHIMVIGFSNLSFMTSQMNKACKLL